MPSVYTAPRFAEKSMSSSSIWSLPDKGHSEAGLGFLVSMWYRFGPETPTSVSLGKTGGAGVGGARTPQGKRLFWSVYALSGHLGRGRANPPGDNFKFFVMFWRFRQETGHSEVGFGFLVSLLYRSDPESSKSVSLGSKYDRKRIFIPGGFARYPLGTQPNSRRHIYIYIAQQGRRRRQGPPEGKRFHTSSSSRQKSVWYGS